MSSNGHVITNSYMLTDNILYQLCNIVNTSDEMRNMILNVKKYQLSDLQIKERKRILNKYYNNEKNAKLLLNKLFN